MREKHMIRSVIQQLMNKAISIIIKAPDQYNMKFVEHSVRRSLGNVVVDRDRSYGTKKTFIIPIGLTNYWFSLPRPGLAAQGATKLTN